MISPLNAKLDRKWIEASQEIEALREIVQSCRSSVKFDLQRYERMVLDYTRLGPEGAEKKQLYETEANRLHNLINKIDGLENKHG